MGRSSAVGTLSAGSDLPLGKVTPRLGPISARLLDRDVGLAPIHIRRHTHFLEPRLARLPAETVKIVGGGSERVRRAVDRIALAVAVEVDRILEIDLGHELELADLSRPGSSHFLRTEVAPLDHFQSIEELLAKFVGPAAIIGERGERAQRVHIAHHLAEIRLQPPKADQHGSRHPIASLKSCRRCRRISSTGSTRSTGGCRSPCGRRIAGSSARTPTARDPWRSRPGRSSPHRAPRR